MKNYYIYYDKNGAFLGGLEKVGKPADKNCKRVSKDEYISTLALNGITYVDKSKTEPEPTEEIVEETVVETETAKEE